VKHGLRLRAKSPVLSFPVFISKKHVSQSSKDLYNTLVESSLGPFCPAVMVIT
jgi:hypothetical protein